MFTFDSDDKPVSVEVTVNGGSFTLQLQKPSLSDRLTDDALAYEVRTSNGKDLTEAYRTKTFRRLALVTGWDGVLDKNGGAIAFSQDQLNRVLAKYPSVMELIHKEFNRLFDEDQVAVGKPDAQPV